MEVRIIGPPEEGSHAFIVELCDDEGTPAAWIYDADDETWECEMCHEQLHGGVRISGALEICDSCVRAFAEANPEELLQEWRAGFGDGLATAERNVDVVRDLVNIYPRWRLVSRRRIRREVFRLRRNLREFTQYLAEPERRESTAEMIDGCRELVAIIDRYFRPPGATD